MNYTFLVEVFPSPASTPTETDRFSCRLHLQGKFTLNSPSYWVPTSCGWGRMISPIKFLLTQAGSSIASYTPLNESQVHWGFAEDSRVKARLSTSLSYLYFVLVSDDFLFSWQIKGSFKETWNIFSDVFIGISKKIIHQVLSTI